MLRDLNLNEMNLVSGGAPGGSGDEIIVTGVRNTSGETWRDATQFGLESSFGGAGSYGQSAGTTGTGGGGSGNSFTPEPVVTNNITDVVVTIDIEVEKGPVKIDAGDISINLSAALRNHFGRLQAQGSVTREESIFDYGGCHDQCPW